MEDRYINRYAMINYYMTFGEHRHNFYNYCLGLHIMPYTVLCRILNIKQDTRTVLEEKFGGIIDKTKLPELGLEKIDDISWIERGLLDIRVDYMLENCRNEIINTIHVLFSFILIIYYGQGEGKDQKIKNLMDHYNAYYHQIREKNYPPNPEQIKEYVIEYYTEKDITTNNNLKIHIEKLESEFIKILETNFDPFEWHEFAEKLKVLTDIINSCMKCIIIPRTGEIDKPSLQENAVPNVVYNNEQIDKYLQYTNSYFVENSSINYFKDGRDHVGLFKKVYELKSMYKEGDKTWTDSCRKLLPISFYIEDEDKKEMLSIVNKMNNYLIIKISIDLLENIHKKIYNENDLAYSIINIPELNCLVLKSVAEVITYNKKESDCFMTLTVATPITQEFKEILKYISKLINEKDIIYEKPGEIEIKPSFFDNKKYFNYLCELTLYKGDKEIDYYMMVLNKIKIKDRLRPDADNFKIYDYINDNLDSQADKDVATKIINEIIENLENFKQEQYDKYGHNYYIEGNKIDYTIKLVYCLKNKEIMQELQNAIYHKCYIYLYNTLQLNL